MATSSTTTTSHLFFSSSLFSNHQSHLSKSLAASFRNPAPMKPLKLITFELATLPVLSFSNEKVNDTYLDLKSAPTETACMVVHRGIITNLQTKRHSTASTLTHGEVCGDDQKPYSQKKTGVACCGSNWTPLRLGGGIMFRLKPQDWSIKINHKEKWLAISTVLASVAVNTVVVEDFTAEFQWPRTKDFVVALRQWGIDPKASMLLVMKLLENIVLMATEIRWFFRSC